MIYYVVAEHDRKVSDEYIRKYIPIDKTIFVTDKEETESMMKKYNIGIRKLENQFKMMPNDIIVFIHEDIKILDPYFEDKLTNSFTEHSDIGVAGVYGSVAYNGGGWWNYDRPKNGRGHITQGGPDGFGSFPMRDSNGIDKNIIVSDGCMLAIKYDRIIQAGNFREEWSGFHHYDNSYCIDTLLFTEYKVAVLDITLFHASIGEITKGWHTGSDKLKEIYSKLNVTYPITTESIKQWRAINGKNCSYE